MYLLGGKFTLGKFDHVQCNHLSQTESSCKNYDFFVSASGCFYSSFNIHWKKILQIILPALRRKLFQIRHNVISCTIALFVQMN